MGTPAAQAGTTAGSRRAGADGVRRPHLHQPPRKTRCSRCASRCAGPPNGCRKGSTSPAGTGTSNRGGTDLDARSRPMCGSSSPPPGIPRDGGMAELRAAVAADAAVRRGDLREHRTVRPGHVRRAEAGENCAGPGCRCSPPTSRSTPRPPRRSTILVRRMKQGIAEYFRYNLKAQMWEGLKQYAIGGYNTGRCPYGYRRGPHPAPQPDEGSRWARPAPGWSPTPNAARGSPGSSNGGCMSSWTATASPAG